MVELWFKAVERFVMAVTFQNANAHRHSQIVGTATSFCTESLISNEVETVNMTPSGT